MLQVATHNALLFTSTWGRVQQVLGALMQSLCLCQAWAAI